jgi:hypothetical protein
MPYTRYNTSEGEKILIHKGTSFFDINKQETFQACLDIPCFINADITGYIICTSDLKETIKLKKE